MHLQKGTHEAPIWGRMHDSDLFSYVKPSVAITGSSMTSRVKMLSVEKVLNRQLQQTDGLSSNQADTSNLAQGAAALKLSKSGCALRTHEQLRRLDVIDRSRNRRGLHENGRMVLSAHRLLKYEKQRKEHWAAVAKKVKAGVLLQESRDGRQEKPSEW